MDAVISRFHSSLEKISCHEAEQIPVITSLEAFWGETISFQITARFSKEYDQDYYSVLSISCPECETEIFEAGLVPCSFPCGPEASGDYITRTPALIPDPLTPYHGNPIRLNSHLSRVFWIDITVPPGMQSTKVQVNFCSHKGDLQYMSNLELQVIPVMLPGQTIHHSEWFYSDCLCDKYSCDMFSEEFFIIAENYVCCAANHGIDTLLTPLFTPSLDIESHCRRSAGQLVQISFTEAGFDYDFSLLKRWVQMAQSCGIQYFEMAPFFTQWGAKFAVEIYVNTPGGRQTFFGWNTPAVNKNYAAFLKDFLPKLVQELKILDIKEKTFFHISDEPPLEHLENYRTARSMIEPYIDDCPIIDAISNFEFYQQGLISIPVVAENFLEPFLKNRKTEMLWTYSCCSQDKLVPNVFLSMPSVRGRILGVLMYKEQLNGFLRWGYNFWNSQFSKHPIDPFHVTDADFGFPSGDGFLVYPGDHGGPVASLRLKLLRDAFQDYRILCALEAHIGRHETLHLIKSYFGDISFTKYSSDNEVFLKFRHGVNQKLNQISQEGEYR